MGRIHAFEFEDQKWFPDFLRNYMTDFLQFLSNKTQMYKPLVPIFNRVLSDYQLKTIVDLGSGGGGGLLWLNSELKKSNPELNVILTDLYPNLTAFEYINQQTDNLNYYPKAVDARKVPEDLKGLRTQFLSLHHFKPADAQAILQNAVHQNQPIFIVEGQERSFASLLAMIFSPISALLTTPFIKPFRFGRIIFTYFIPLVPLFVLWDGVISSLRTYSVKEMKTLVDSLDQKEQFDWEINRVKSGPATILYLIGLPKN